MIQCSLISVLFFKMYSVFLSFRMPGFVLTTGRFSSNQVKFAWFLSWLKSPSELCRSMENNSAPPGMKGQRFGLKRNFGVMFVHRGKPEFRQVTETELVRRSIHPSFIKPEKNSD